MFIVFLVMNILAIQFNCPTKFTPIAQRKMLQEVSKNARVSSRDLQAALETVNMNDVLQSNIRRKVHKSGRSARKKTSFSKKKRCPTPT